MSAMEELQAAMRASCTSFRKLGRGVKAIEPCVGLGGLREASSRNGFGYDSVAYDTGKSLTPFYKQRGKAEDLQKLQLNIGDCAGDILRLSLDDLDLLADRECLIAGPPCQPFNESGARLGARGARAEVLDRLTDWIVYLGVERIAEVFLYRKQQKDRQRASCQL